MTELLFGASGVATYRMFRIEQEAPVGAIGYALQNQAVSIFCAQLLWICMFFLALFFFLTRTVPILIETVRGLRARPIRPINAQRRPKS